MSIFKVDSAAVIAAQHGGARPVVEMPTKPYAGGGKRKRAAPLEALTGRARLCVAAHAGARGEQVGPDSATASGPAAAASPPTASPAAAAASPPTVSPAAAAASHQSLAPGAGASSDDGGAAVVANHAAAVARVGEHLLPAHSCAVVGDLLASPLRGAVRRLLALAGGRCSVVSMDPPWPSRSAQRKREYATSHGNLAPLVASLARLPVRALARSDGGPTAVVVWITNNPAVEAAVRETLFPAWRAAPAGEWMWVKTSSGGELLGPVDSDHRKPYELALVALINPTPAAEAALARAAAVVAVPIRHSHKPNLDRLLAPFEALRPGAKVELFARDAKSGWVAAGDEALRFQSAAGFEGGDR